MIYVLALIFSLFCSLVSAQQPTDQVWLFVGDPTLAMQGKSSCGPCNRLCSDLQKYYETADDGRYIIGEQPGAMFRVIQSAPDRPVPRIKFPGQAEIVGYDGKHEDLVKKHPNSGRIKKS